MHFHHHSLCLHSPTLALVSSVTAVTQTVTQLDSFGLVTEKKKKEQFGVQKFHQCTYDLLVSHQPQHLQQARTWIKFTSCYLYLPKKSLPRNAIKIILQLKESLYSLSMLLIRSEASLKDRKYDLRTATNLLFPI